MNFGMGRLAVKARKMPGLLDPHGREILRSQDVELVEHQLVAVMLEQDLPDQFVLRHRPVQRLPRAAGDDVNAVVIFDFQVRREDLGLTVTGTVEGHGLAGANGSDPGVRIPRTSRSWATALW